MFAGRFLVKLNPSLAKLERPLHREIYEQVRRAVREGQLKPGDRLPATRDLARQLGLARNTVTRAYDDLTAEGYLETRLGAGTFVSSRWPAAGGAPGAGSPAATSKAAADAAGEPARAEAEAGTAGERPRAMAVSARAGWALWAQRLTPEVGPARALAYDFRPIAPDWSTFPRTVWLRLLGRALRRGAGELSAYGEPAGYLPLRRAIAQHLAISRGVVATAEQIVITSGSQQAIDLLVRLRVDPGDAVVVEDPGYPWARRAFAAAGARLLPVSVDEDGLDVGELARQVPWSTAPRLVYVTPSHQFPTGATMSLARRFALLEWAANRDVLVVEDDYDSEFRHSGRPVESLQGLDRRAKVVYVGTFSTVLFPPLRIGYVVLPADLVGPFVQGKSIADRQTPILEQLALTDFLEEGHFERHLRRMRREATVRRAALLAALAEQLGQQIETPRAAAGMHLMLVLKLPRTSGAAPADLEAAVVAGAAAQDVGVYPVAPCYARPPERAALLLGYAALRTEQIRAGIGRLSAVVKAVCQRRAI